MTRDCMRRPARSHQRAMCAMNDSVRESAKDGGFVMVSPLRGGCGDSEELRPPQLPTWRVSEYLDQTRRHRSSYRFGPTLTQYQRTRIVRVTRRAAIVGIPSDPAGPSRERLQRTSRSTYRAPRVEVGNGPSDHSPTRHGPSAATGGPFRVSLSLHGPAGGPFGLNAKTPPESGDVSTSQDPNPFTVVPGSTRPGRRDRSGWRRPAARTAGFFASYLSDIT